MRRRGWWLTITGTGYCGTGYLSRVLNSVNVKCTHEGIFSPDNEIITRMTTRISNAWWGWQAESSWLAMPYLVYPQMSKMTVVHLVRHPIRVISTIVRMKGFEENTGGPFYAFQCRHLPELLEPRNQLDKAALFYIRWNQLIEPHTTVRWRIEDDVLRLLDQLQIEYDGKDVFMDTSFNSHYGYGYEEKLDANLNDVSEPLRTELRMMTERYGYEWPDH